MAPSAAATAALGLFKVAAVPSAKPGPSPPKSVETRPVVGLIETMRWLAMSARMRRDAAASKEMPMFVVKNAPFPVPSAKPATPPTKAATAPAGLMVRTVVSQLWDVYSVPDAANATLCSAWKRALVPRPLVTPWVVDPARVVTAPVASDTARTRVVSAV